MTFVQQKTLIESKVSQEQSLKQAQQLLTIGFNSILYLRDLFPESCFDADRSTGLELKKLRRGSHPKVDKFLDLVERGCWDALAKQYLRSVILNIFTDKRDPGAVTESYNLTFSYPERLENPFLTTLSINQNDRNVVNVSSDSGQLDFGKATNRMVRQLCRQIQQLPLLPRKKYLQMSVLYYEEWTPTTYCPSGFKLTEKEALPVMLFKGPSQLHDFGNAASPYHAVHFSLERRQDSNYENSVNDLTVDPSQPLVIGQPSQQVDAPVFEEAPSTHVSSPIAKKNCEPANNSPGVAEITQTTQALTFETPHLVQPRILPPALPPSPPPNQITTTNNLPMKKVEETESVGGNSDLDMIQCEQCNLWQHTVCAGFFSNSKDERIKHSAYICYGCTHKGDQKILRNLNDLCNFRRVLSVTFNEKVEGPTFLKERLSLDNYTKAKKYFDKLKHEGFISKVHREHKEKSGNKIVYEPVRSKRVREAIRKYFQPQLDSFPNFRKIFQSSQAQPSKQPPITVLSQPSPTAVALSQSQPSPSAATTIAPLKHYASVASVLSCVTSESQNY